MDGKKLEYKGARALKELERLTTKAGEVQQEILRKILEQNWDTEYLKKYLGDSSISSKSVVQFKSRVPAIGYKEIGPYIVRIANGEDSNLITGHPIIEMLCSSGTSAGEPKLMPSIAEDLDRRTFVYNLIMPIVNQHVPGLDEGKAMYLYFVKSETSTPCGMAARTVLTSYYNSSHFKHRPHDPYNDFTSPDAAILCNDSHQSIATGATSAATSAQATSTPPSATQHAALPCSAYLAPQTRTRRLRSRASAAAQLRDGAEVLQRRAAAVGLYDVCFVGMLLRSEHEAAVRSVRGFLHATSQYGYFEFIPLAGDNGSLSMEDDEAPPPLTDLVELVDVKLGCYYELVVTTFSGLYRYRIGDVLQVTGFHNEAPQFRFICRRNVVLSIDNDKTNEEDLHRSITAAASRLLEPRHALLVEYTSYADTSSIPGHYVIYWEINDAIQLHAPPISANVLRECCITVEEGLDYVYRRCRTNDRSVGPLEIRVVKPGTFEKLMDLFIAQGGASINQYKTPRCVKSKPALKLLNANVSDCYFSPRDPAWHA
ncbi:putative indole-3-acetic acid-amido synthetase GH3.9 [Perilla frutescens var. frutescens]|nr:putative indole-3-acetic acid-amido synthetase GH3.9 [Perilla frutescens var. frutescens]